MEIVFGYADIFTAFGRAVGTKVLNSNKFLAALTEAVEKFEFPESGQALIPLPESVYPYVSCGVARREGLRPEDFVVREYRGRMGIYAKRKFAAPVESLHVVVYTKSAYLKDPDITPEETAKMNQSPLPTHIVVAVLAAAGPKSPYGSRVLCHNIAGGNNSFLPKTTKELIKGLEINSLPATTTSESFLGWVGQKKLQLVVNDIKMLHRWIELAKESEQYENTWVGVADE